MSKPNVWSLCTNTDYKVPKNRYPEDLRLEINFATGIWMPWTQLGLAKSSNKVGLLVLELLLPLLLLLQLLLLLLLLLFDLTNKRIEISKTFEDLVSPPPQTCWTCWPCGSSPGRSLSPHPPQSLPHRCSQAWQVDSALWRYDCKVDSTLWEIFSLTFSLKTDQTLWAVWKTIRQMVTRPDQAITN